MFQGVRLVRFFAMALLPVAFSACGETPTMPSAVQAAAASKAVALKAPYLKHAASMLYIGSVGGFIDTFTLVKGQYEKTAQLVDYNGPEGIHTDADANLYVADQGIGTEGPGVGEILIYPKGSSNPERYIVPGYNVSDVVPAGIDSYLYSTNFGPDGYFGPGSLSYYAPTGNNPVWTSVIDNSFQAWGLVRDPKSTDVFVSYSVAHSSGGSVVRFLHGRRKAHVVASIGSPGGMAEDGSGNLLAASSGSIAIISQSGKSLGSISVSGRAYRMAFNKDYSLLYVTNYGNFDVEIFSYPAGTLVGTITSSDWSKYNWTDGIAAWPPPKQ
jgi:sugar lactone lactonase YvrE